MHGFDLPLALRRPIFYAHDVSAPAVQRLVRVTEIRDVIAAGDEPKPPVVDMMAALRDALAKKEKEGESK